MLTHDSKTYIKFSQESSLKFEGALKLKSLYGKIKCFGYELKENMVISDSKKNMVLSLSNVEGEKAVPK